MRAFAGGGPSGGGFCRFTAATAPAFEGGSPGGGPGGRFALAALPAALGGPAKAGAVGAGGGPGGLCGAFRAAIAARPEAALIAARTALGAAEGR